MLLCLVYYSLFFCILFLVARKWHLFIYLLLLYISIIMVALSHYCCRTTLQCQCHVLQAKEQSQYLSATVQREHKTCPGVNPQGKGQVFPYSLPSVGPGADPGVQAVSPQVT